MSRIFPPNDSLGIRHDLYLREITHPWRHFENLYNPWVFIPELQGDRYAVDARKVRICGEELSLIYRISEQLSWQSERWRLGLKGGAAWQA